MTLPDRLPILAAPDDRPWSPHPRDAGVQMQTLTTRDLTPAASIHHVQIDVGREIAPHTHDIQIETFYVISGRGEGLVGEERRTMEPGAWASVPPGVVHALRNTGDEPLELLAIFTPPLF